MLARKQKIVVCCSIQCYCLLAPIDEVRNVTITHVNNSIVILKWDPVGSLGGNLIGFYVRLLNMEGMVVFNQTVLPNQSEIELKALMPFTVYHYQVHALKRKGDGKIAFGQFFTDKGGKYSIYFYAVSWTSLGFISRCHNFFLCFQR